MPIYDADLVPSMQISFTYYNSKWAGRDVQNRSRPIVGVFQGWDKTQFKMLVSGVWYVRYSCYYLRTV